jgi:hypothetical protein
VRMTDPGGTLRYVPEDQVNAATQAGGKLYQDPTQIPETNGIPWGSGGQGPLELRGKMIPQAAPQTPNVQAQPVQPAAPISQVPQAQPTAPMVQFDPVANSSQLAGHAYDPQTQTATMQFSNGQIHQYYGVTPEDWANYRAQSSPGKGFQTYIKRDPATGAGRTSRPLTATSAKSAAQETPPATANELLERYVGLF